MQKAVPSARVAGLWLNPETSSGPPHPLKGRCQFNTQPGTTDSQQMRRKTPRVQGRSRMKTGLSSTQTLQPQAVQLILRTPWHWRGSCSQAQHWVRSRSSVWSMWHGRRRVPWYTQTRPFLPRKCSGWAMDVVRQTALRRQVIPDQGFHPGLEMAK